ncbi:hypothetical protein VitviT2T_023437 [Vitis vinifera]|uniref:DUF4216 domain-containing protein n=1 Tax=Vitis vinifera TaxID=29760 RepID=A0ABY9DEQ6_VITVI|nr:hypothetical protein VitviT2T_023437 [Vitis vinifera]
MTMVSTTYKLNNRLPDNVVAQTIVAGFTGQLKGWWDNYLTFDDRNSILKAYKINENNEVVKDKNGQDIEDAVATLIYLISKHFIRGPAKIKNKTAGAAENCLQEGLVPVQLCVKTSESLFGANGKRLAIKCKLTDVYIRNHGICIKQTFILVKDLKEKALLGIPFLSSIYPMFGFSRSYQKWIFHGEEHESQPNEQNDIGVDTEIVDATDADILNEVVDALNDACGHIDNDINLEESTTHGKFDYLLGEANKEFEHTKELEKTSSHNLEKRQEQEFPKWLADRMKALCVKQSPEATDELYSLACGPDNRVHTYMGCIVNGVRFHTKDRDDRRITQNSGICVSGEHDGEEIDFYGVLSNVVVLNYVLGYKVILFKCTWFDTNQKKKRIKHDYNFTTIQVTSTWYDNDPFILATQAQQVFYLDDYKNGHNWKVVQKVNHRHMWDVPERGTNIEIDEEVCGGSDEEAYQDNESHELNWFVEQDDGFEFQRSDRLNIDPKVVNDNVLILENMNDNDDNFICDDIEEEDETLDDYANENEMWLSSDSESESD